MTSDAAIGGRIVSFVLENPPVHASCFIKPVGSNVSIRVEADGPTMEAAMRALREKVRELFGVDGLAPLFHDSDIDAALS